MPTHNAREYIARAVISALDQTHRDVELIVIDDGSTDDTAVVAARAAKGDRRFTLVQLETNRGPAGARNAGLEIATGQWIALLDSDDTFAPVRLKRMLRMAEERGADLLSDNLVLSATAGSAHGVCAIPAEFMTKEAAVSADEFIAMDRPSYGIHAVGFLKPIMRAGFLRENKLRYDTAYRNGEDFHFYVKALLRGARLFVTPDAWYQYWFRPGSQCRGAEAPYPHQLIAANDDLVKIAEKCGDHRAAFELRKRRKEIDCWIPYSFFVADLKQRKHMKAVQSFCRLPSQAYAVRKLGAAGLRRIRGAPELKLLAGQS
jgi:glycosyltransferase involved in cell wall biosynthesis